MRDEDANGPYVVWENCKYDGWWPVSYDTLKEALQAERRTGFVVTHGPICDETTAPELLRTIVNHKPWGYPGDFESLTGQQKMLWIQGWGQEDDGTVIEDPTKWQERRDA